MAEKACAVSSMEKPAARSVPITVSWWCSVAGPGAVREETSAIAQGWRPSAARAEIARSRIAGRHSLPISGSSISPKTASVMPSSRSLLLATCL
jgi:hypothetical protein